MSIERLATDMGDLLCVSATAAVVAFWCWQQLDRLATAAFALAYVTVLLVTTGLKLISANVGQSLHDAALLQLSAGAPSGHVAMAVVVYGSAAYLARRTARGWEAILCQVACGLVVLIVAVTRVTLHAHTVADVVAGAVVGGLVLATPVTLIWSRSRGQPGTARWLLAGMAAMGVFMLASGARLPSDRFFA
jgi:membrane-associated phospholipid phosphatase